MTDTEAPSEVAALAALLHPNVCEYPDMPHLNPDLRHCVEVAARLIAADVSLRPPADEGLRAALLSIIGEAEEVTEAQHGTPIRALEAIIRRARAALAATPAPLDGRSLARAWNEHRRKVLFSHPDNAQDCWPENCSDDIAAEYARLAPDSAQPRRCVECGEPWPCNATVTNRKDGIPHRLKVAPDSAQGEDEA